MVAERRCLVRASDTEQKRWCTFPSAPGRAVTQSSDAEDGPRATSAKRALVMDDNVDVAEMLAAYLRQIGHEVIQAHDGRTGLDAAFRHQ